METSEYFRMPDRTKQLLKTFLKRTDEQKAETAAKFHKAKSDSHDPKSVLTHEIYKTENTIARWQSSKSIDLLDRIPELESKLKRLKVELSNLEN